MTPLENTIPYGFCHCGCGNKTPVAPQTKTSLGWVKGQPVRFRPGHGRKGNRDSHLRAQVRRPLPIFLEVDGEPCVRVPLQKERWALVSLSSFDKIKHLSWLASTNNYAAARDASGRPVFMHRIICGTQEGMSTDHINHDTLDNRDGNLRACTHQQNMMNRTAGLNVSGFRGVTKQTLSDTWVSRIQVGKKTHYLGTFISREEAFAAYQEASKIHFGEFANNE